MPSGLHFNKTGSNIVEKCQQVSRSQSLLQHTWLALQLSEISVFTGARKKRFLSFERKPWVPEQTSFKIVLVLLPSSQTRGLKMTCSGFSPLEGNGVCVQSPRGRALPQLLSRSTDAHFETAMGNDFNVMNLLHHQWPKMHIATVCVGDASACWAHGITRHFSCSPLTSPHPTLPTSTLIFIKNLTKIRGTRQKIDSAPTTATW